MPVPPMPIPMPCCPGPTSRPEPFSPVPVPGGVAGEIARKIRADIDALKNGKADKAAGAAEGNLAALDENGSPVGSGVPKDGVYLAPEGGIPKSDLAGDVQASLGKADTALQEHQSLAAYVNAASYDPEYGDPAKPTILLKHGDTVVATVDASAFVIDGMVSTVAVTGGNLVITFNTDAGKQDISIPLTSFFNPSNYYDKTAADARFATKADATLTERTGTVWVYSNFQAPTGWTLDDTPPVYNAGDVWYATAHNGDDVVGMTGPGGEDATSLHLMYESEAGTFEVYADKIALQGMVLGSQTSKPLASEAEVEALRQGKFDKVDVVAPSTSASVSGKAADAKATGDALAARPTKADIDAGWWSDWTIKRDGVDVTSQVPQPRWVPEEDSWWVFESVVSGDESNVSLVGNSLDDISISWTSTNLTTSSDVPYTATRHRVAAPVPTKPEDIGAATAAQGALALTAVQPAGIATKVNDSAVAPEFDASASYAVGDVVMHDGLRYKCTTAVSTAGSWTGSTNWATETVQSAIAAAGTSELPTAVYDNTTDPNLKLTADGSIFRATVVTGGYWIVSKSGASDLRLNYGGEVAGDRVYWSDGNYDTNTHKIYLFKSGARGFDYIITQGSFYHDPTTADGVNIASFVSGDYTCTYYPQAKDFPTAKNAQFALEDLPSASFAASTIYVVGDVVKSDGKAYRCKSAYTSAASSPTAPSSDSTHWTEIPVLTQKMDKPASQLTPATKCKVTYDENGLVTAGANLEPEDVPALPYMPTGAHVRRVWADDDSSTVDAEGVMRGTSLAVSKWTMVRAGSTTVMDYLALSNGNYYWGSWSSGMLYTPSDGKLYWRFGSSWPDKTEIKQDLTGKDPTLDSCTFDTFTGNVNGESAKLTFTPAQLAETAGMIARFALESIPDREYSTSATYAVGDLVKYRATSSNPYKAYRCSTAITTAENWNSAHWDEIPVLTQKADAADLHYSFNAATVTPGTSGWTSNYSQIYDKYGELVDVNMPGWSTESTPDGDKTGWFWYNPDGVYDLLSEDESATSLTAYWEGDNGGEEYIEYNISFSNTTSPATVTNVANRAINTATFGSSVTAATVTLPAAVTGRSRDFYIDLTIEATDAPTLTFTDPATSTTANVAFGAESLADIAPGYNLVLWTELPNNRWLVSVRHEEASS